MWREFNREDAVVQGDVEFMLGALVGDIVGSVHEWAGTKTKNFPLFTNHSHFTDDSVLTVAVADALLNGRNYVDAFHEFVSAYPSAGYGGRFYSWALSHDTEPYQSFGNGSAMRVSPVAYAFNTLEEVLREAERSAAVTHNHAEGIKGAQAVAAATFLARTGNSKRQIRDYVEEKFSYDLSANLDSIRHSYKFDVTCQGSVPQSIISFLESENFEDAIRNAISLGGDADTQACMAGAIAEAYYGGIATHIADEAMKRLDAPLMGIVETFRLRFGKAEKIA